MYLVKAKLFFKFQVTQELRKKRCYFQVLNKWKLYCELEHIVHSLTVGYVLRVRAQSIPVL